MNKTLTLLFVSLFYFTLFSKAQINKGGSFIGGTLGFSSSTYKTDSSKGTTNYIILSPSFAYCYKNNCFLGFSVMYGHNHPDTLNPSNTLGVGVFLRQYKSLGKSFYLFAEEGLNFSEEKAPSSGGTNYAYSTYVYFSPGFAYDLMQKIQLELVLNNILYAGYFKAKFKPYSGEPDNANASYHSFNITSDFSLKQLSYVNVGLRVFVSRK